MTMTMTRRNRGFRGCVDDVGVVVVSVGGGGDAVSLGAGECGRRRFRGRRPSRMPRRRDGVVGVAPIRLSRAATPLSFLLFVLLLSSSSSSVSSASAFSPFGVTPTSSVGRGRAGGKKKRSGELNVATAAYDRDAFRPARSSPSSDDDPAEKNTPNVGVLLLNLGGPETSDDVEGFLYNLFADPDIIRLPKFLGPFQGLIAYAIAKRRAPKSREAYNSIGGGSPILKYSNEQAELLCRSVRDRYGIDVKSYVGMRYWHPYTEDALRQIRRDNIDALVIVPLYPQFSISTSGSSLRVLQEEFSTAVSSSLASSPDRKNGNSGMVHTVVPSWYNRDGYVDAMTELIQTEIRSFTPGEREEGLAALKTTDEDGRKKPIHILFSAHGVPKSYVDIGDPYQRQIEDCVRRIERNLMNKYPDNRDDIQVHLSYQSRVGPIEWLRPYTDDVLPELGEDKGVKNLVVVPISFVSEHIETLEEIDIEYRELALESGIVNWRRCPALNTDDLFIRDMADMVVEALSQPALTVTEACVNNNVSGLSLLAGNDDVITSEINAAGVQGVGGGSDLYYRQQRRQQQQRNEKNRGRGGDSDAVGSSPSSSALSERRGDLKFTELLNARVAILGLLITLAVELVNGKSLVQLFGM